MPSSTSRIGEALKPGDPALLHEQAAAQIRRAIAQGAAKPGDRLPPAKDLAAVMGVNRNTVLQALRALRDEGLLELRPGRGATVTATPEQSLMLSRVRELRDRGQRYGYSPEELAELIINLP